MIASILMIIFGIPHGVFIHRKSFKGILAYFFIIVAIFVCLSVIDPSRTVDVVESTTLIEYFISLTQYCFGAGVGWIISYLWEKMKRNS